MTTDSVRSGSQAVENAIEILFAIASGTNDFADISRQIGTPKGTTHRLLASLGRRNMVVQDPKTREYILGPGCIALLSSLFNTVGVLARTARETLEHLRDETGESAVLHMQMGLNRVCIAEIASQDPLRYISEVGSSAPLHIGAAGKVLLAHASDEVQQSVLANLPGAKTSSADPDHHDRATLLAELALVKKRGWATSHSERVIGASAVSVLVPSTASHLPLALSLLGPSQRIETADPKRLRRLLHAAANQLSNDPSLML